MEPFDLRQWKRAGRSSAVPLIIDDVTVDSRAIRSPRCLFVALQGQKGDGHHHVANALKSGAAFAVVSNHYVAPTAIDEAQLIRVDNTLEALQNLAASYRATMPSLRIVAVAGSCGKTMVKDLLSHLFFGPSVYTSPESFNSQLGVALSLLHIPKETTLAFIEMAATKPGEMARLVDMVRPQMTLVTNFCRKRLGTRDKQRVVADEIVTLLLALPHDGFAIVERDGPLPTLPCPVFFWNEHPSVTSSGIPNSGRLPIIVHDPDGSQTALSIKGAHLYLVELLSLAVKAAWKLDLPHDQVIKALNTYQPEVMRSEIWKNGRGTSFINGTYCHTALSFDASLDELKGYTAHREKTILVFGGLRDPKSSTHRIAESLVSHAISEIHAWPTNIGETLKTALSGRIPIHVHKSLLDAITAAKGRASTADTIVFKGPRKIPFDWLIEQLEESPPNTVACINLAAIRTNIELLRSHLKPDKRIMVMVKALAYGTDDVRISQFLQSCGVDILGVSYVNEAVSLRQIGVTQSLFAIHASETEMKKAAHWNVEVGVCSPQQIKAAIEAAQEQQTVLKVHLHIDTGMKRFGCRSTEALCLAQSIAASPHLSLEGLFTHFPVADDPAQDDFTLSQADTLTSVLTTLHQANIHPTYTHACNSAASIRFSFDQFNMVRIGLATYGFHPSEASLSLLELRPALSLITRIAGFNEATAGETVSYGRTHVITHPKARLAVLPIGYYDGLHRAYSGKGSVLIRGKQAPMVGRICMDYMMVDVTHIPEASVGDYALLFGEDERGTYLSPESLASAGGSIVHELMTCLGPRVQRLFIYDESLLTR